MAEPKQPEQDVEVCDGCGLEFPASEINEDGLCADCEEADSDTDDEDGDDE